MELRVLGAHNMESKGSRMESHLIDGVLVLDAGGLTRALTFDEQVGIRAIILSHRHFDHVRDLLPLGLALRNSGATADVYGIQDTIDAVRSKLLDGCLYLDFLHETNNDFLKSPDLENPTFRLHAVEFYQEFKVLDYNVVAVPVPHAVPAAGFQISSKNVKLFYTGDTGRGLSDAWKHVSPDVLLTECTYGDENETSAISQGHLIPAYLGEALAIFRREHGYFPKVIVAHMNPSWEEKVRMELETLSREMKIEILISHEDMAISL